MIGPALSGDDHELKLREDAGADECHERRGTPPRNVRRLITRPTQAIPSVWVGVRPRWLSIEAEGASRAPFVEPRFVAFLADAEHHQPD